MSLFSKIFNSFKSIRLNQSHRELKHHCATWKEYTASYIFGRAIWGGSNNDGMIEIADDLLNNEKSPLKGKNYL